MLNKKKKTVEVENNTVIILLQSCSVRDPDSGFLFNLQPLATEKGYTTTGIGKTYLVRILTVQSVAYGFCCCFFFFLLVILSELQLLLYPLMRFKLAEGHCT